MRLWVHRNKGTWRDIRSAFTLTRLRHGRESTCSTICLACQTKNSAMSSTSHPEANCLKQRRVQRLPSSKKPDKSSQCQSGYVAANIFVRRTETSRGFIERAGRGPLSVKADLMSRHVPSVLRWTHPYAANAHSIVKRTTGFRQTASI